MLFYIYKYKYKMPVIFGDLNSKFVALITKLQVCKNELDRIIAENPLHPNPNEINMGLVRMHAASMYVPYQESAHYNLHLYKKGTPQYTYATNFMLQREYRKPVKRITFWIEILYCLQKTYLKDGSVSFQYREAIPDLINLLDIKIEGETERSNAFNEVITTLAQTNFDWKANGFDTDEYDRNVEKWRQLIETYKPEPQSIEKLVETYKKENNL